MGQQELRIQMSAKWGRVACMLALALPLWPLTAGVSQSVPASEPGPIQTSPGSTRPRLGSDPLDPANPLGPGNAARLEHMREDERHKRLVADTAKLVALTNELKAEVEKASKDELSLDVVRKAAEIEKLARDVKDRMKS